MTEYEYKQPNIIEETIKQTNMSNIQIRSVELNDNGFKGASVSHHQEEKRNGRKQQVLHKAYPKNPIHLALERPFKDLRIHLLELCGYIHDGLKKDRVDQIIQETYVTCIEYDGIYIQVFGERRMFVDKYVELKSPKMQPEDGYVNYEGLKALFETIEQETIFYLDGTAKIEDEDVAMRYIAEKKSDKIDVEAVLAMSAEDRKLWASKVIESGYKDVGLEIIKEPIEVVEVEEGEGIQVPDQPERVKVKRGKKPKEPEKKQEILVTHNAAGEELF